MTKGQNTGFVNIFRPILQSKVVDILLEMFTSLGFFYGVTFEFGEIILAILVISQQLRDILGDKKIQTSRMCLKSVSIERKLKNIPLMSAANQPWFKCVDFVFKLDVDQTNAHTQILLRFFGWLFLKWGNYILKKILIFFLA